MPTHRRLGPLGPLPPHFLGFTHVFLKGCIWSYIALSLGTYPVLNVLNVTDVSPISYYYTLGVTLITLTTFTSHPTIPPQPHLTWTVTLEDVTL